MLPAKVAKQTQSGHATAATQLPDAAQSRDAMHLRTPHPQAGNRKSVSGVSSVMLEARRLTKVYSRVRAVSDVSFTIRPGEILGYLGPNGSGKSTTVHMLTGLIEPTAGEILLDGRAIKDDWIAYKRRLGYVPEEPHVYPYLAGREYLQLIARLRELSQAPSEKRIDDLLHLFGLHPHRYSPISAYSKGMKQKILLA
jgi:ABC-2 type transport system ATP-binding protein